jgi:hypothetical protein
MSSQDEKLGLAYFVVFIAVPFAVVSGIGLFVGWLIWG